MSSVAVHINGVDWTAINTAGQNGNCWLIKGPLVGRVLLDHSTSGTGSLNVAKAYTIPDNKEVITEILTDDDSDIFYAKCSESYENAVIIFDDLRSISGISPGNSTDIPLGSGGIFTGSWIEVIDYGIAYVNVYSDVVSATDGLVIEQSADGINADHKDYFTVPSNTGKNYSINPHARYMRIVYTNGATLQTVFRLQLKLNLNGLASSHRTVDDITTEDDCRLNKSIMSVKLNDQNIFRNIDFMNPMPVNGPSTFVHDVNITNSSVGTFNGSILDIFDNRFSTITDNTSNNPKVITINFERTIQSTSFGFATASGNFSNVVIKWGITGVPDQLFYDGSADNTKRTFQNFPTIPLTFSRIIIEFHTADPVSISFFNAAKAYQRISQIQGQSDFDELLNIGATNGGNLKVSVQEYGDTPAIDAFDRLRVSEPFTIFDSKQLYDKQPLFYDENIGGSATSVHSQVHARTRETVTASATDYVIRQTKQRFNYQPGKGQLILLTFQASQETGCTKRVGVFNGTGTNYLTPFNGIFLEITETDVSWNIAKNGSTTETFTQSNWNVDKLDGTGLSRLTLDLDATQIAVIDFEWLGVGRVRCGFVIDGIITYAHYFNHANLPAYDSVYMSSPNLPVRYDIQSDGTGGGYLDHICSTVMSEGGLELTGVSRSVDTDGNHLDANAADTPYVLIAIRLKTTHLDLTVLPEFISVLSETNDDFRWSLLLNPTYNGTLTWIDLPFNGCQYAFGATANDITDEGVKFDSGYAKSASSVDRQIKTSLRIGSNIDGTRDILVLCITPMSSNADYQGSLTFRELL